MIELLISCLTMTGLVENCVPIVDHIVETNEMVETPRLIRHLGYSDDSEVQDMVEYAYLLGGMELVTLIECENGQWRPDRVSKTNDYGLCGINPRWHEIPDWWDNWQIQIDYCYEKMKGGTKFYGRGRRIDGQRCAEYVLDRFVLEYNMSLEG